MTLFNRPTTPQLFTIVVVLSMPYLLYCARVERDQSKRVLFSIDDREYGIDEPLLDYNRLKATMMVSDSNRDEQRKIKEEFLMRYIDEELLFLEAQRRGIRPDPEMVNREFDEMKDGHTEMTFNSYLSSLMLTENLLKDKIARRFVIEELINSLVKGREFEEKELLAYYNSHREEFKVPSLCRMRQIVVKFKDEAQNIFNQLKRGAPFEDLARRYSISPEAKNGGDLGFLPEDSIDEYFIQECRRLKESEISEIKESQEGYRIYKMIKYLPAREQRFEEVKKRIELILLDQEREEKYNNLLRNLRAEHKIIINNELLHKID